MKLVIVLLVPFLLIGKNTFSQTREWGIEASPKLGYLMAHRGIMGHLSKEHAISGEITYFVQTNGTRSYHKAYNYPKFGVTLFGSTTGNKEILGNLYGLYSFVDFPLAKGKKQELVGRLGAGLSYLTKVFDQELNPKNVAISTHLNALICLGLRYRYYIGSSHILLGLDISHASNASTRVPNLGLNLPFISLGYGYTFKRQEKIENLETFEARKWKFSALGILSVKQIFPTGGKNYPIYALSIIGNKKFTQKAGLELALDVFYKTSINGYKPHIPKTPLSILQAGVYAGYVLPLNKLEFIAGMGFYYLDKYNPDDKLYHRVGMRYHVNDHLLINLSLKTHWAKADYTEYGIGYTF
ncbi:MAG: acyloxyacyl hydrolase [Crocinitomicaceae bacterium]|nr:acyloxyacyl hydrolase [Crocinitomicaceae bacterium]